MIKWPRYTKHELASCFNCGGDFGDGHWMRDGNAPGHGEFSQDCCKCGMRTWYDLETES
jgi:hypothetical protein